jgi:hypothetical protein
LEVQGRSPRPPSADPGRSAAGCPVCLGGDEVALFLFAFAFAFAGPDLGARELPAAGLVRVEPVRIGVEPTRLDLRQRSGRGVGLLQLAGPAGGGVGLGLDGPLLGRWLSAAAGSGRGRSGSGEREGGRLLPVAQRPRSDSDRGGGLVLRPSTGEQPGGLPLLGGALTLAAALVGELLLRPRPRAAPAPAPEGGLASGRLGGGERAGGRSRLGRPQRRWVGERRTDVDGIEPEPVPVRTPAGEAALELLEDRFGGEPVRAGVDVRQLQL